MRVGLGYDLHRLVEGRRLVIGGVEIAHPRGLDGHSDADVLTHAVIDALLGAAALGTIGEHFPDTDERFAGISSLELLAMAAGLVEEAGYRVVNVDSVVIAQEPRLQAHLAEMATLLADRIGLERQAVAVKATSPEAVGALGLEDEAAGSRAAVHGIGPRFPAAFIHLQEGTGARDMAPDKVKDEGRVKDRIRRVRLGILGGGQRWTRR